MTYNPDTKHGDIYDEAMRDEPRRWFGQCSIDPYKCVLIKGQGKVPYDPALHNGQRTSVCIHITITPCDPTSKLIERDPLSWMPEFTQAIRPSIEALADKIKALKPPQGTEPFNPLRSISGLWVAGEFVARPGNKTGETWTTLKFTEVFKDQAECESAWKKASEQPADDTPLSTPAANGNGSTPVQTVDPNKAALVAAFPAIWAANQADKSKFLTAIASVFPADAPEVEAFIAAQPGQQPF